MSRTIHWDPVALDDFDRLLGDIAERDVRSADKIEQAIHGSLERLSHHDIGRK